VQQSYILSIQHSRPDGRLLEETFRQTGMDVGLFTIYSAEAALDYLRDRSNRRPALILTASRFGVMTAVQILKVIKADSRLRGIPVLVIKSYMRQDEIDELFSEHASSVIEIPGKLSELENMVRLIKAYWFGIAGIVPAEDRSQETAR
jgi:CheY-like chemotaxis protein